ncbi:histidine kinase N-terminal 7TM domain-containing protein [Saccharibacillus sp. JS10]|uniref:histidine kinase N-terminal 7TM domain-containing diguanylate cyclase n=1 Tax=Saccharibacillus sp. JS10 TaxID=2950552 RepID=UPI00210C8F75|nr:histidine kinase N-terminal 7TM domain-containing protein [Saccharibacillus sp. JS10]MCQ4087926.1 diguanylate cyclase [Saccharibacillus sp. JS10]
MAQQLLGYVTVVLLGGALSLFLVGYAMFRFRQAPGGQYYMLAALMACIFSFGYAFELTSTTLSQAKFWIGIEYFALPFLPVFTLLMCLEYTNIQIGPWKKRALFFIPLLTFIIQHTNDLHHLYYTSMAFRPDIPFLIIDLGKGPWYFVHTIYLYSCLAIAIVALSVRMFKIKGQFRLQIAFMIAGLIFPIIGNLYYLAGKSPYGIDLGPVFISISFVFHSMALFRFRMFNVAPIAREIVFENMGDGVLVFNHQDVIVDYNRAMLRFLPELSKRSIGQTAAQELVAYPAIAKCVEVGGASDLQLGTEQTIYVHIRFSPIQGRNMSRAGRIATFVDITERVVLEQKLKKLASTDGLTGLFNKNTLIQKSEEIIRELLPKSPGVSVIMFDVDYFKKVNDTFGHEAGDRVLTEVAKVIQHALGKKDIAGRYGGDEFVLSLPNTTIDQAVRVAEQIRSSIEQLSMVVQDQTICVTSSFGVSHLPPIMHYTYGSQEMQMLMRNADQALYISKKRGRNCVSVYEEPETPTLEAN